MAINNPDPPDESLELQRRLVESQEAYLRELEDMRRRMGVGSPAVSLTPETAFDVRREEAEAQARQAAEREVRAAREAEAFQGRLAVAAARAEQEAREEAAREARQETAEQARAARQVARATLTRARHLAGLMGAREEARDEGEGDEARRQRQLAREAAQMGRDVRRQELALAREQEREQREQQREARDAARGTLARARQMASLLEAREKGREAQEREIARAPEVLPTGAQRARAAYAGFPTPADQRETTWDSIIGARRAQAEANYEDTPQGQSQVARRARADVAREEAEARSREARARAENTARYGPGLGGAMNTARELMEPVQAFRGVMGNLHPVVAAVTTAFRAVRGAVMDAWARIKDLGQAASPAVAQTVQGSGQMLKAELGSAVLPIMMEVARAFQNAAGGVRESRQQFPETWRAMGNLPADLLRNMGEGRAFGPPTNTLAIADRVAQALSGQRGAEDTREAIKMSYAGLPGGNVYDRPSDVGRAAQLAALRTDPLQAELLTTQIRNLEELLGVARKIEGNTSRGWQFPGF